MPGHPVPPQPDVSAVCPPLHASNLDDLEILAVRACQDSQNGLRSEALGELFEQYSATVWRYVYRRVGSAADIADDIAGDVWLRVARNMSSYRSAGSGTFGKWLITIAHHATVDHYRARSRSRLDFTGDMLTDASLPWAKNGAHHKTAWSAHELGPEELAERADAAADIARIANRLPARQREVLLYRFWHGRSIAETAQILGLTVGTVKQLQFRGVERMRKILCG